MGGFGQRNSIDSWRRRDEEADMKVNENQQTILTAQLWSNSEYSAFPFAKEEWRDERILHSAQNLILCCCSVTKSCPTLCKPTNYSMPGFLVLHYLLELAQTHVHWVGDAIQPSHPLSFPSPPAFNLSQHHGLFQWVNCSHQVAKVLEFQLQHQSFQ